MVKGRIPTDSFVLAVLQDSVLIFAMIILAAVYCHDTALSMYIQILGSFKVISLITILYRNSRIKK